MTIEELLQPRWKVIADYPGSIFIIGQIVKKVKALSGKEFVRGMQQQPDDFPTIFKELQWWEDRKPEDMPLYVKWDYKPKVDNINVKGLVDKVIKWVQGGFGVVVSGSMTIATCHWLPATEEEYDAYIKTLEEPLTS